MKALRVMFGLLIGIVLAGAVAAPAQAAATTRNKVMIYPAPGETLDQLQKQGIANVDNYGSYWVADATDEQVGTLKGRYGTRLQKANHLFRIELNAMPLDTSLGERGIHKSLAQAASTGKRLRLIQFKGPVKPQWLADVRSITNCRVVSYIPNNAYVVQVDAVAETALTKLTEPTGPIQFIGGYHPAYKLKPNLLTSTNAVTRIRVGIINSTDSGRTTEALQGLNVSKKTMYVKRLPEEVRATLVVNTADLAAIAQLPDVLWVEPVVTFANHDEELSLIAAERISSMPGHAPIAPFAGGQRYLDFITNTVGFSTNPLEYPILDIADSGLDNGTTAPYHPGFYQGPSLGTIDFIRWWYGCGFVFPGATKIVYNWGVDTVGHGTAAASVAAGYDDFPGVFESGAYSNLGTRACHDFQCGNAVCHWECCQVSSVPWSVVRRDFNGFNLGLGISPYGMIGASLGAAAIPNPPGFDPYNHALNIYLSRARISNNSWGEILVVGLSDGVYDSFSVDYDTLTRDAVLTGQGGSLPAPFPLNQEMTYVFAGGDNNGVGTQGGYGDILFTPPSTAKNVISVGASIALGPCTTGQDTFDLGTSTSYGPAADGRIKPEIVAPADGLVVSVSQSMPPTPTLVRGCDPDFPRMPNNYCFVNGPGPAGYPNCDNNTCLDPTPFQIQPIGLPAGLPLYMCGIAPGGYANTTTDPGLATDGIPNNMISTFSGSSFAAPAVSGSIQLLWWYFEHRLLNEQGQHLFQPSPAMARAYLVNCARYLPITNPQTGIIDKLPSIAQGFGVLDLQTMFDGIPRVIRDETTPRAIDTPVITTNALPQQTYFSAAGQTFEMTGQVADRTKPFRVTLAWTDPAGNPAALKQLVNDLDLEVTVGGQTYKGNVFDRQFSINDPYQPADDLNNLECVFLPPGQTGTWKVVVRAIAVNGNAVPNIAGTPVGQDYALVIYNATDSSDVPNRAVNNSTQTALSITNFPYVWTNSITNAKYHKLHPNSTGGRSGGEAFFKIVNPTLGVSFTANTFGSSFDTVISVWKGLPGSLVEVAANDNANGTFQSQVSWTATEKTTYYILVAGRVTGTGQSVEDSAALRVTATQPPISFMPNPLDFGNIMLGSTSAVRIAAMANNTLQNLTVAGITVDGPDASNFSLRSENCSGSRFPPSGSCQLELQFIPQPPAGLKTNAFVVVTDDATGSPRLLQLMGYASPSAPVVCLSGNSLMYGSQMLGTTSTPQIVTIQNCGKADLIISNVTASGDFLVNAGCAPFPATIPPDGTCTLSISYRPTTSGLPTGLVSIVHNAISSPDTVALAGVPCPVITLSPAAVPGGVTGTFYSQGFTPSCGTPPFTFAVSMGTLPSGITINTNAGVISGVPTVSGTNTFTITATDIFGNVGTHTYVLGIACPGMALSPVTIPAQAIVGMPYNSVQFSAAGGAAPYSYTSVSLPAGLVLIVSGALTGTPTIAGTYAFTVAATDRYGCSVNQSYTLNISCQNPNILPQQLPNAMVNQSYAQPLSVSGGSLPFTFVKLTGSLPPGMTLSPLGLISGTPLAQGAFDVKVRVIDGLGCMGDRWYRLTVTCPSITISPSVLSPGTNWAAYSTQQLSASGGLTNYTFAVTAGSLPAGMGLTPDGMLTGTPATASSVFTVTATDAAGCFGTRTYLLPVVELPPPVVISPVTLVSAKRGQFYRQTLTAVGGNGPLSFSIAAGTLPPGVTLTGSGQLSGTPQTVGTTSFTVRASDSDGNAGTQAYTFNVACPITVNPATLATGTVGQAYSQTLSATNGVAPYTFTVVGGTLPTDLAFSNGLISGIPGAAGTNNFSVAIADTTGCTITQDYALVILPTSADVGVAIVAQPASATVASNVTYLIAVTNAGPSLATGVVLTNLLPQAVNFVSASASQGTVNPVGTNVVANLGNLASGASATVTVAVTPLRVGNLTNLATVCTDLFDTNPTNNTAVLQTPVTSTSSVDLSGGNGSISHNATSSTIRVRFSVTNTGGATSSKKGTVQCYRSTTPTLNGTEPKLGSALAIGALKPRGVKKFDFRVKVPAAASGQYVIAVIDPNHVVAETDESNNTVSVGIIP